jgi:predicted DCC family thiol-disulfide oxidoreductase YuxK
MESGMNSLPTDKAVILFDGACNLCNGAVTFVIERDTRDYFRFSPLQSEVASTFLRGSEEVLPDSIVLVEDGLVFTRSDAALRIARQLGGGYPILYAFILLPRWIRDLSYDWVARNRSRWFGRREACMIPTEEFRGKFIE